MLPSELYAASRHGASVTTWQGELAIECQEIGQLFLPSGSIVAGDPFFVGHRPFEQSVSPGYYPVVLCITHSERTSDQRVALAMLRMSDEEPIAWKMATVAGQDLNTLKQDEIYGYPVDSGTGSFMDIQAQELLAKRLDENPDYFQDVIHLLEKTYIPTWDWANLILDSASGLNAMLFASGFGDGFYASYWGYTNSGTVACLMTDFRLLVK